MEICVTSKLRVRRPRPRTMQAVSPSLVAEEVIFAELSSPTPLLSPGTPPFVFSRLDDEEKEELPDPADYLDDEDEDEDGGIAQYELRLHHPERSGGTVPVRAGGAGGSAAGASRAASLGVAVERAHMQVDELRQFKTLCDRLLPGLRSQSHLYTLIHLDDRTYTLTLSEWGEVIGGATFRLVQATDTPWLLLDVLLLAVEQRAGVCGRGHGTRLVNYLKELAMRVARRRGLAAALLAQSDWQAEVPGGGAAWQFWTRQRLRATPQATLLTRALFQWDKANEVYAHAAPMLCWLSPSMPPRQVLCPVRLSARAQQQVRASPHRARISHRARMSPSSLGRLECL